MSLPFAPERHREDAEAALLGRIMPAMARNLLAARQRGKTDWRLERVEDLVAHLKAEVRELEVEIAKGRAHEAWSEAADVALLAAMVVDARFL